MSNGFNATEVAEQVLEQESRKHAALAVLLDEYLDKQGKIFVERSKMGGTVSFIGSVTLQWLAQRVSFAHQLSLFRNKLDPETKQLIIDNQTIDLIQQRPLDWSRQAALTQYLAVRPHHKFPPILAVVSHPWVDNSKSDEWDSRGRAIRDVTDFTPLDSNGKVGLLDVSEDFDIFALDGQHRLMGVQGLMQLILEGKLVRKDSDGMPSQKKITLEDLEEVYQNYGINRAKIQSLKSEKIGIELISAVTAGESREDARRRVRSIFVHVNMQASRLPKGQLNQLDEDDGFAIVARQVATNHPLLKVNDRVDFSSSNIPESSTALTVLSTLREMADSYLLLKFPHWKQPEKGLIPMRPEAEELEDGIALFSTLWDYISNLPSFNKLDSGKKNAANFRGFDKNEDGHMLFRPIGQQALAKALGKLFFKENRPLDDLFQLLQKYDSEGGFSMNHRSSIWYWVLYDPQKNKIIKNGATLASRLLQYLLGGKFSDNDLERLRHDLSNSRTITLEDGNKKAVGFDEEELIDPTKLKLPPAISI